jgi:hypothetical protein
MRNVSLILMMIIVQSMNAQVVDFEWAKNFSGTQQEVGKSIASDDLGNIYTAGYFTGTVDFDPSANTHNLSSVGQLDIYITKLNSTGDLVWAKRIGGSGTDMAYSMVLDSFRNIYFTGHFKSTVDFDPGNGVYNLSSSTSGSQDIFISKLDSLGNFIWAKSFGGSGYYDSLGNVYDGISVGYGIQLDKQGNVYTTGRFLGEIDFNPGIGIDKLTALSVPNIFISKLNSDGEFVWAKKMGENKKGDEAYAIAIDDMSNIYTTGVFNDTADFDPSVSVYNLVAQGYNNAFISKLDSMGNFVWAKQFGGNTQFDQAIGYSLALDHNGFLIATGVFKGSGDFNPGLGTQIMTSTGGYDVFVAKINSSGNLIWAQKFGGINSEYVYSIVIDNLNAMYLCGSFKDNVDFDPSINSFILSSNAPGTTDAYIVKLNEAGGFNWALKMGGSGHDLANALAVDQQNQLTTTGYYSGLADFDPTIGIHQLQALGNLDAFIIHFNQNSMILPVTLKEFIGVEVSSGNLLKWLTINEINANYFDLEKSIDGKLFNSIARIECLMNVDQVSKYSYLDKNAIANKNYYRLKQIDQDGQYHYSNIISLSNTNSDNTISVYPNPSSGKISIVTKSNFKNALLQIKDMKGAITFEKRNIEGNSFNYDISSLANGIYILDIIETSSVQYSNSKRLITTIHIVK